MSSTSGSFSLFLSISALSFFPLRSPLMVDRACKQIFNQSIKPFLSLTFLFVFLSSLFLIILSLSFFLSFSSPAFYPSLFSSFTVSFSLVLPSLLPSLFLFFSILFLSHLPLVYSFLSLALTLSSISPSLSLSLTEKLPYIYQKEKKIRMR